MPLLGSLLRPAAASSTRVGCWSGGGRRPSRSPSGCGGDAPAIARDALSHPLSGSVTLSEAASAASDVAHNRDSSGRGHGAALPLAPAQGGAGAAAAEAIDLPLRVAPTRAGARDGGATAASGQTYAGSPVTSSQAAVSLAAAERRAYRAIGPRDFQAIREIGQGAFGKVYLVQSRSTKRFYAMKVLNKQRVIQKEQVGYAMGERAVMSSLAHPYLVALRYSFQTAHRLFLVMDYVEGGHLWTHMRSGFLAEPVAKVFAAEIALALVHLHALGIAHRDLKPENILLDSEQHLRLTDFGLAKRDLSADSRAHTMVGTIDYMAPEIVKGEGHGCAVDWWSLGVLLYEMLFARLPFAPTPTRGGPKGRRARDPRLEPGTDEYKAEVKRKIQHGKVAWPRGPYVNAVSTTAKNLIQRLLAKLPDARLAGEDVLAHEWFRDIDWDALYARQVPSPLRSSIFAGAPDKLSQGSTEMAPLEAPCPRLAGYLFEKDTPPDSPGAEARESLLSKFQGFSFVHESELHSAVTNSVSAADGRLKGAF